MKMRLPTSWDNITVGKFQELHPVITSDGRLVKRVPALISTVLRRSFRRCKEYIQIEALQRG